MPRRKDPQSLSHGSAADVEECRKIGFVGQPITWRQIAFKNHPAKFVCHLLIGRTNRPDVPDQVGAAGPGRGTS